MRGRQSQVLSPLRRVHRSTAMLLCLVFNLTATVAPGVAAVNATGPSAVTSGAIPSGAMTSPIGALSTAGATRAVPGVAGQPPSGTARIRDMRSASISTVGSSLAGIHLGATAADVIAALGAPQWTVRPNGMTVWRYENDHGNAWLLIGFIGTTVSSLHEIARQGHRATLRSAAGYLLGAPVASVAQATQGMRHDLLLGAYFASGNLPNETTYISIDASLRLSRFGIATRHDIGLDPYIVDADAGDAPDRPISVADVGGSLPTLREEYLSRTACLGGEHAHITANVVRASIGSTRASVAATYHCGASSTLRTEYFAQSDEIAAASILMPASHVATNENATSRRSLSRLSGSALTAAPGSSGRQASSANVAGGAQPVDPVIVRAFAARNAPKQFGRSMRGRRSTKDTVVGGSDDVWITSILSASSQSPNGARIVSSGGDISSVGYNIGLATDAADPISSVNMYYGTAGSYESLPCSFTPGATTATCAGTATGVVASQTSAVATSSKLRREKAASTRTNVSGCFLGSVSSYYEGLPIGEGWICSFNAGDSWQSPTLYVTRQPGDNEPGFTCQPNNQPFIFLQPGYTAPGLSEYIAGVESAPSIDCNDLDGVKVGISYAGPDPFESSMEFFEREPATYCQNFPYSHCINVQEDFALFGVLPIALPGPAPTSKVCALAAAQHASGATTVSEVGCFYAADSARDFPATPPETCHCGQPIDVTSGDLFYDADDFSLSGPGGFELSRHYSTHPRFNESNYGQGWTDTYNAQLQFTNYGNTQQVAFIDDKNEVSYFNIAGSKSDYDNISGSTLTANADGTYTLTTWNNTVYTFSSSGFMTSLTDRAGNMQTLTRNSGGALLAATDALGRSLHYALDNFGRVSAITSSPAGVSMTFSYDNGVNCFQGDLCSVRESDGSVWSYQYIQAANASPAQDLLSEVIDPRGNIEEANTYAQQTISGDTHYVVTHQNIQNNKESLNLTYTDGTGSSPSSTTVVDGLGRTTSYTWDPLLRQVLSVNGPLCHCNGNSLAFTFDTFGRVTSRIEGTGKVVVSTYTYGSDTLFNAPDGSASYIQSAYPQVATKTVQLSPSQSTTYTYQYYPIGDPRQDLVNVATRPSVDTAGQSAQTTFTYDPNGSLTSLSRTGFVNGAAATLTDHRTYDARGRILTYTAPRTDLTATSHFSYFSDSDADLARRGQLATVTDALGHVTKLANAAAPSNTYSLYGTPLSATDPNNVTATFTIDARGRVITSTLLGVPGDTKNLTATTKYDTLGSVIGGTRPLGNGESISYDGTENPTKLALLDAQKAQHDAIAVSYDGMDQPSSRTWQSCPSPSSSCSSWATTRSETYGYTSNGNLATIKYPTGGATTFGYDGAGNQVTAKTGDSSYAYTQTSAYDYAHRQTSTALSPSDTTVVSYDTDSNMSAVKQNASNILTTYRHDDFGRTTAQVSPVTGTTTYGYDGDDNLTNTVDAIGDRTTQTFDALDRQLTSVSSRSGVPTETTTWAYDSSAVGAYGIGRLAKMTDPTGSTTYAYERRGMPTTQTKVVGSSTYVTKSVYDGNGNETQRTLPSGRVLAYSYDYADRPSGVTGTLAGATTPYVSSATYLPFGPITRIAFGNGTVQQRSYDTRYQPAEISLAGSAGTLSDIAYTNNAGSFVTAETDRLNAGYNRGYTYGGKSTIALTGASTGSALWGNATYTDSNDEKLTTINFPTHPTLLTYNSANQPTRATNTATNTTSTITYNANGDETAYGSAKYAYSARDFLASGDGLSYTYDGSGERTTATASSGKRVSLYDNSQELQSESDLANGSIAYDYIWLAGLPVAQSDIGGQTHWTATDHLGTPFLQTDTTGKAYWQADYEPYGSVFALRTPDVHQPLRFPGQEAEQFTVGNPNGSSASFYNQARWYRPILGQYTQADPSVFWADKHNAYAYAALNPPRFIDQLGLSSGTPSDWYVSHELGPDQGATPNTFLDENGFLSENALQGSRPIMQNARLGNPSLPPGVSKWETKTYCPRNAPAGKYHFYRSSNGDPYYDQDYKFKFNTPKGGGSPWNNFAPSETDPTVPAPAPGPLNDSIPELPTTFEPELP